MPRGQNPNSLANLKKGHKFDSSDDLLRKKAAEKRKEMKSIAEEMRELASASSNDGKSTRRKVLAAKLLNNMEKSPAWYELGLKVLGEMPAEQIEVKQPVYDLSGFTVEELKAMIDED